MPNAFSGGMLTGRNAEWRNADSYCPILGGMPKIGGTEMKACPWQTNHVPPIVMVNVCFYELLGAYILCL